LRLRLQLRFAWPPHSDVGAALYRLCGVCSDNNLWGLRLRRNRHMCLRLHRLHGDGRMLRLRLGGGRSMVRSLRHLCSDGRHLRLRCLTWIQLRLRGL